MNDVEPKTNFKKQEQQIVEMLQESLETNKKIEKYLKFIKRYYYRRTIFNTLKIVIFVLAIIFSAISFNSLLKYFDSYNKSISSYSSQLTALSELMKNGDMFLKLQQK